MSVKSILVVACVCVGMLALLSCADVPSTAPEFPDFRTQTRFIQADASLGSAQIMVDGSGVGSVDFQAATAYLDIAAGNRSLQVQGDAEARSIGLQTDGKITIVVFPKVAASDPRFRVFQERQTFAPLPGDVGQVRFINAAGGGNFDILDTSDNSVVAEGLGFGSASNYADFTGSFTFGVAAAGTQNELGSVQVTLASGQRFTAVIFGDQAAPAVTAFQDD